MAGSVTGRDAWRGSRSRRALWAGAGLMFLLPLAAMQITDEMAWDGGDFVVWGAMLGLACGVFDLAASGARSRAYRAGAALALGTAFLVVWMNLAVGIIGSESNPANRMFFGVLGIGAVGALAVRLRPRGMAATMVAVAIAQMAAAVTALVAGWGNVLPLTAILVALWLASALLFDRAARNPQP